MVASINGYIILSLLFTSAYFVGLLTFFADNEREKDKCDMTYMFELPQYVRISNNYDHKFPKYKLYYYDEGPPHEKTPKFWGIPVLFIPGNAGSHKQVRSLASVALRKSMNKRLPYHFDYFTINMNEELTGLSGISLEDQLNYVNHSLHLILTLYKNQRFSPTSVVLIGHSMGGVIARKLAQMTSSPVHIVITLASPHRRSPIILDEYISSFYLDVNQPVRPDITFISLSGGYSDLLVPTTLTDSKDNTSIYAVTTHIPLSWAPADHKQILWCKQTVLVLTRCLFDSIDTKKGQITSSSEYRRQVFEHHLLRHSGINPKFRDRYDSRTSVETDSQWTEKLERQYSVRFLKGTKQLHWYMVRLVDDPKHEMLTVIALNLDVVDWIYACGAYIPRKNYQVCDEGMHLTHLSRIDPSARYKRRSLTINLHNLKKNYSDEFSHVIFKVGPTQEPIVYHVDVYNALERQVKFNLPPWWNLWRKSIIKETAESALTYEIFLPNLSHVMQSFNLYVKPYMCSKESHHATASLVIPWSNENSHKHFTDTDKAPFHIRLYNSKPSNAEGSAFIKLILDPTCRYEVSIRRSYTGSLCQLIRFYTPLLIVNVATVVLLLLKTQLQSLDSEKECTSFFVALKSGTKPFYVLCLSRIASLIVSSTALPLALPAADSVILKEEGTDFFFLYYIMYLISVGLIWLFASMITVSITLCESMVHKFFLRFLTKTVPLTLFWSDYVVTALQKVPFLVSTVIIFISYNNCGGLALALGTIFYFLKLTQMSQDYIEETVFNVIKCLIVKYRMKFKFQFKKSRKSQVNDSREITCLTDEQTIEPDECKIDNESTKPDISAVEGDGKLEETETLSSTSTEPNNIVSDSKDDESHAPESTNEILPKISPPSAISFHGVMFLIWVLVTLINVPSILTWARNYRYSTSLRPDPSFLPGFSLGLCTLFLWQFEMPNPRKLWYKKISYLIYVIAMLGLVYAPIYLYRLNYLLPSVVIIIVAHQMLAPTSQESFGGNEDDEDRSKYENIKAKLE